jgi:hypothetical protein
VIENEIGGSPRSAIVLTLIIFVVLATVAAVPFAGPLMVTRRMPDSCRCINNLRQIEGAKARWAIAARKGDNDTPSMTDIAQYIRGGVPNCPAGGVYTLGPVAESPRCSIVGHVLP